IRNTNPLQPNAFRPLLVIENQLTRKLRLGRTAVCAFQEVTGCAATWLASQRGGWPDPEVSCDDAMAVIRDQSVHSHNIVIPCYTRCGDEYINGLYMTASPKLGGVWWLRSHMTPASDGFCTNPTSRHYQVDFRFARQQDLGEYTVFSKSFLECGPFDEWTLNQMSEYGVTGISACAGALWEWPEEECGRPLATKESEATADAETDAPKVFEYRLGRAYPNPCNGCSGVTVEYSLAGVSVPRFELYDLLGQRVLSMGEGMKAPGEYALRWDLRDFGGKRVPPATYILQMRTEGFVGRTPLVVIR
ncbi:hypothetical protein JXA88_03110, partial [Candidatus Fermentibacteria bacterium]|nr:hypothetical protein [Candidatus Fermentibacteria bacterium]